MVPLLKYRRAVIRGVDESVVGHVHVYVPLSVATTQVAVVEGSVRVVGRRLDAVNLELYRICRAAASVGAGVQRSGGVGRSGPASPGDRRGSVLAAPVTTIAATTIAATASEARRRHSLAISPRAIGPTLIRYRVLRVRLRRPMKS